MTLAPDLRDQKTGGGEGGAHQHPDQEHCSSRPQVRGPHPRSSDPSLPLYQLPLTSR